MDKDINAKKKKLIAIIKSINNESVLEYLLMYVMLVLKRWD